MKNMIQKISISKISLLSMGVACLVSSQCWAQVATADASPTATTAEQVLARYVEVTGGAEKYKQIKGMLQEAEMNLEVAGINGKMTMAYGGDGKFLVEVDLGGIANEKSGISDDTGWSMSTMMGNRIITGKELEQLKLQLDMRQYYEPAAIYSKMELIGQEDVKGEKCHVLKLTTKGGDVKQEYFSVDSGLKLKTKQTADTAMGEIPVEIHYKDYKELDGMTHAMKMIQMLPNNMEMEIVTTKIQLNPKFAEDKFELPAEIRRLKN